jgi:hypothetical protein
MYLLLFSLRCVSRDTVRDVTLDNDKLILPREDWDEWTRKRIEIGTANFMEERYNAMATSEQQVT